MKDYIKNNFKVISILIIVILIAAIGVTFAYTMDAINVNLTTGEYAVVYSGTASLPASDLRPILDAELTNSSNSSKVLKIDFSVKGAESNPTDVPIIYDVSLTDLNLDPALKSEYFKWRLYKNGRQISEGSFSPAFDALVDNRMVLTSIQQDLPDYDETADSYTLYIWVSEACTGSISTCTPEEHDQSDLLNKTFSGNVRIELSTKGKKKLIREQNASNVTLTNLDLIDSLKNDTPTFSKTSCSSGCDEATVGIYAMEDDLGTSYYFRGDVNNNYVYFANLYWRIIRINGDGTIRMIYMGTDKNSTVLEPISTDSLSLYIGDNTDVGYKISFDLDNFAFLNDDGFSTSYSEAHANLYDNGIKTFLEGNIDEDGWYKTNIVDTGYSEYVADAIYCNDRSLSSGNGFAYYETYYGGYQRLIVDNEPTLKCDLASYTNDKFTQTYELGNGELKYPIGLITADEIVLAGGAYDKGNAKFYLNTNYGINTMTPSYFSEDEMSAYMFYLDPGGIINDYTFGSDAVVPVISLKRNVIIDGNGTKDLPFVVE